jgi:biofilm PGA synthesis N-glycosyltransferase PgaC
MATNTASKLQEITPENASRAPSGVLTEFAPTHETGVVLGRPFYLPVKAKFAIASGTAIVWVVLSFYLARPWLDDLSQVIGDVPAFLAILFIAFIPGFLNAHILTSIVLDKPPPLPLDISYPPLSILIAAYNEASNIEARWKSLSWTTVPPTGPLRFYPRCECPI